MGDHHMLPSERLQCASPAQQTESAAQHMLPQANHGSVITPHQVCNIKHTHRLLFITHYLHIYDIIRNTHHHAFTVFAIPPYLTACILSIIIILAFLF